MRRVDAVEQDASAVQLVEAHDQVHERRLAGPRGAHDRDRLARLDRQRQVVDERLVLLVAEVDVLELEPTMEVGRGDGLGRVGRLIVCVKEFEDPLGARHAGLQQVGHGTQLAERLLELSRVLDERLDVAQGQVAAGDLEPSDHGNADIHQVSHEHG